MIVLPTMLLACLVSWFLVVTARVRNADVQEWALMRALMDLRHKAKWVINTIVVGIIANAIWQILIWPQFSG